MKSKATEMKTIKYIIARYVCVVALEKNSSFYSWFWLLLPNWRFYIRLKHNKEHKRFGRYSNHYWTPNRIELWRINGYKYKIRNIFKRVYFLYPLL